MPYILALDQGTTSSRAIVFDHDGAIVAVAQKEFRADLSAPGLGRARPGGDLGDADRASPWKRSAGHGCRPRDVAAIGITNQRETTSCGTARPASRSTTRSSGRIGAPPSSAIGCKRGRPRAADSPSARAWSSTRIFRARKIALDARQRAGRARPRRGRASWPSARSTRGWSGS